jgi:hypothetical protein
MQADTAQRRLLTVPEAARELHVSRDWAYQNLPIIRLGAGQGRGQVARVRPEDVVRLRGDGR